MGSDPKLSQDAMAASELRLDTLRVAVVEDDEEFRGHIVVDLAERGAVVYGFGSAAALYRHLAVHVCDIVVLDIGLPDEDGYMVAAYLRQLAAVGIVMLTGRGDASDMTRGLRRGADLYLVKPVELDVLAASLLSLRRRLSPPSAPSMPPESQVHQMSASRWSLVANGWSLRSPTGRELALNSAERALMCPLFAAPGLPVAREVLIAGLTSEPADFDPHRLEVYMHRLRRRTYVATGEQLPVRAVRGAGYLLVPEPR